MLEKIRTVCSILSLFLLMVVVHHTIGLAGLLLNLLLIILAVGLVILGCHFIVGLFIVGKEIIDDLRGEEDE